MHFCPYCSEKSENYDEIEEHMNNAHREYPETKRVNVYTCEYCNDVFNDKTEAFVHEMKHEDDGDTKHKFNESSLESAREHPNQTRLFCNDIGD